MTAVDLASSLLLRRTRGFSANARVNVANMFSMPRTNGRAELA